MAEQINKDRLNELLGIKEGQTFDDYMNDGTDDMSDAQSVIDQTTQLIQETKDSISEIDDKFNQQIEVIDQGKRQLQSMDENGSASQRIDTMVNVENAFKSIEDLVDTTKQMIANVYGIISSCDVLDSETVSAAASLIGETRQLIGEYTSLYKQRVKFFDNVKMETLKQQNRLELLERKHQLDMEKYDKQHPSVPADATEIRDGQEVPSGMVQVGTDDMLKWMKELDDEADVEEVQDEDQNEQ